MFNRKFVHDVRIKTFQIIVQCTCWYQRTGLIYSKWINPPKCEYVCVYFSLTSKTISLHYNAENYISLGFKHRRLLTWTYFYTRPKINEFCDSLPAKTMKIFHLVFLKSYHLWMFVHIAFHSLIQFKLTWWVDTKFSINVNKSWSILTLNLLTLIFMNIIVTYDNTEKKIVFMKLSR